MRKWTPEICLGRDRIAFVESLERHVELVRSCSLCFPGGGNAPVVDVPKGVRVLLVGQAPGLTEVSTRLPFTGPAGKRLESWFTEAGVSRGEIYLYDANGTTYTYEVTEIFEVLPSETWVLKSDPGRNMVSLQTCIENYGDYWTEGPNWFARYIVRADRV